MQHDEEPHTVTQLNICLTIMSDGNHAFHACNQDTN